MFITISEERWIKAKNMIKWISETCEGASGVIDFKTLESYSGFLIYICRTYPAINPYLKGIHLTLDSWRPWCSEDFWKLSMAEIRAAWLKEGEDSASLNFSSEPPCQVKIAPRLYDDIKALEALFSPEHPPLRQVRTSKSTVASYMFGDASGTGFGSTFQGDSGLRYTYGQWDVLSSKESSNFRELSNLVHAIDNASLSGSLDDSELFVFTDNFAAKSSFFKGTSSSKHLFELMLSLRKLQMHRGLQLHLIHIAGTRMISQGTDGLSRGSASTGVMSGQNMLQFVPLNLDALMRKGESLTQWVSSWFIGLDSPLFLSPKDWFTRGYNYSTCIWTPPPTCCCRCGFRAISIQHP
jgi:hypothetical protein